MRPILLLVAVAACGGKTATSSSTGRALERSIRSIDWQNHTYGAYTVAGGETDLYYDARDQELAPSEWAVQYPGIEPVARGYFMVSAPVFGDIDGDGAED